MIGASLAALAVIGAGAGAAQAQNMGARRTVDPSVAAAQASQSAAQRNAAAAAAAQRTRASFAAASRVRAQMDAAQNAARQAALIAESSVPNGLGTGGLKPSADIAIDPSLWVGANGPTQAQGADGRTNVTIDQTQEKAILTWETFNVGRETDLRFNHKGNSSWMTLNRVTDPNANPTQILGSIKADGSIYIINPNGVIFGGASQVNVRSIIASSLDIHAGTVE
ncbi:filamentous hemagglutinin N-terminal domain-containing protein, partial [Sandaracinobacter sp. RS1-74]|uniref:two-partner secretion domain-containing protein n=1 Tax=Sandaracinobacteroides sayramensis TaxID=2913411 RepID=UPI001EDA563F